MSDATATEGKAEKAAVPDNVFNRNKLVDVVMAQSELPRAKAVKAIESVLTAIESALKQGHEVRLVGFGTFNVVERKAAKGRNPRTGEEIDIPESKSVRFKPGKTLKEAVGD